MRVFSTREVEEAVAHAMAGGVALHLHRIIPDRARAPRCFVQAVDRGEPIAHLFCQDKLQLVALARALGIRVLKIDREGTSHQHIDLCSGPLWQACRRVVAEEQEKLKTVLASLKPHKVVPSVSRKETNVAPESFAPQG